MARRRRLASEQNRASVAMPLGHKFDIDNKLLEYAAKNANAKRPNGSISPDLSRTEYERDYHRILFSLAFRRLRHKTQVFYSPMNDHICTRMEHSLQVASIADTVCRNLSLNVDLANAIALGHDLGHAPFGHTGEEALDDLCKKAGLGAFIHEAYSLRVVEEMKELHGDALNLTYQVRDGIVCHCGEQYDRVLRPDVEKNLIDVSCAWARKQKPYTMEGCVVRYVDRVAYLPVDLQDAIELRIIRATQVPKHIRDTLGTDSGEIIGIITEDMITASLDQPYIATSDKVFSCICDLYEFSRKYIYNCDHISRQKVRAEKIIGDLFTEFLRVLNNSDRGQNSGFRKECKEKAYQVFFGFLDMMQYDQSTSPAQIVLDYVAGMTDNFALRSYDEIFLSIPMPLPAPSFGNMRRRD